MAISLKSHKQLYDDYLARKSEPGLSAAQLDQLESEHKNYYFSFLSFLSFYLERSFLEMSVQELMESGMPLAEAAMQVASQEPDLQFSCMLSHLTDFENDMIFLLSQMLRVHDLNA
mmetsp:Transcript_17505/g.29487  ORF Transcript_17505/g.29487 Transcript_17505/m.29487 type:complete len:116 (+) Transcript_17505:1028-1375(+)